MSAQRRLDAPAEDARVAAFAPLISPDPTPATEAATSPARLLQDRLKAAYQLEEDYASNTDLPPLVRLAILLGSACGLWVCLGGLAFLILR